MLSIIQINICISLYFYILSIVLIEEWTKSIESSFKASQGNNTTNKKLEKQRKEKKKELNHLEDKKEVILDKYNLGYDYDSDEAPKELKTIEK